MIKREFNFFVLIALLCFVTTKLCPQSYTISNVAGLRTIGYSGDGGPATNAHLYNPIAVFADNSGTIYISDWANSRLRIVTSTGIISTIAGNGVFGFSGDGGSATLAELNGPMGIFTDASGNIYLADVGNERIRKINSSGIINTIAGNGTYGFSGDGGLATLAAFEDPAGVCGDESGNIFVADEFNYRVRKINSSGIISTIGGCGARGYAGDGGPATQAEFYYPSGVAADNMGNIFVADESNNCVRQINSSGVISTIAGNGVAGFAGDGEPAFLSELSNPAGVTTDNKGNIYIADGFNSRIRKINNTGVISTIAGDGIAGYTGIGGAAALTALYNPVSIAADTSGNFYLANEFSNYVQKLTPSADAFTPALVTIFPNPTPGIFSIKISNFQATLHLQLYTILGERISSFDLDKEVTLLNLSSYSKGVYIYRIISSDEKIFATGKVVLI